MPELHIIDDSAGTWWRWSNALVHLWHVCERATILEIGCKYFFTYYI